MSQSMRSNIVEHFEALTDPRTKEPTYPLINIVVIAVCAVVAGFDDFVGIAEFGRQKRQWLSKFLDLSKGIPSHDRFNHLFRFIKPDEFEKCLLSWITSIHEITDGQVVAIDGKTLRRSYDKKDSKSAIHMVSAWASVNSISLGQVVVDEKSNEITAIPKLLEILEIKGCLVTIDAMGCQVEIAKRIVDQGADYALSVKGNQPTLFEGVQNAVNDHLEKSPSLKGKFYHKTVEKGHGRHETREYYVLDAPKDLPDRSRWTKLHAIGLACNTTVRDGQKSVEFRYYILHSA